MAPTTQDFYFLFCDHKFKKFSETLQEGFFGMYFVLKILSEAKSELSAGDISNTFGVSTARTAVVLNTLEKKGFVKKTKSDTDARKTIVKITNIGKNILEERKSKLFGVLDTFLNKLTKVEQEQFFALLKKLLTN